MRNINEDNITQAVIAGHASATDVRFRELMTSLVQHLHAFAREARLTEAEWRDGINFLADAGQLTDDKRQEIILLSDTLGLSTLVMAQNQKKPRGCTEATVTGPIHIESPQRRDSDETPAPDRRCLIKGRVANLEGHGIADAEIDVWQVGATGLCRNPNGGNRNGGHIALRSEADGTFQFHTSVAEAFPIPHDGPVGLMLQKLGRHPWRPAHMHFVIKTPGYQTLVTDIFRGGDRYLDSDALFGVRQSLIADWTEQPDGSYLMDFTFVLNRDDNTQQPGE